MEKDHMFLLFWLVPSSLSYDPKRKGKFWGLKNSIFQSEIMQFHRISRTGEAVQGLSSPIIKHQFGVITLTIKKPPID